MRFSQNLFIKTLWQLISESLKVWALIFVEKCATNYTGFSFFSHAETSWHILLWVWMWRPSTVKERNSNFASQLLCGRRAIICLGLVIKVGPIFCILAFSQALSIRPKSWYSHLSAKATLASRFSSHTLSINFVGFYKNTSALAKYGSSLGANTALFQALKKQTRVLTARALAGRFLLALA